MATHQAQEDPELLSKFIELLEANKPISLPRQTVLGAISHYISTLSTPDLRPLLEAISASHYLWDSTHHQSSAREAIKLGVSGAIDRISSEPSSSRWWKRTDPATALLDEICVATKKLDGQRRLDMMIAFLSGVKGSRVEGGRCRWSGIKRAELEDQITLEFAERLEETKLRRQDMATTELLCGLLEVIDDIRIRVLDTQAIKMQLLSLLPLGLIEPPTSSSTAPSISPATISRSIARLFSILNDGDADCRLQAWTGMHQLCIQMRGIIACVPPIPAATVKAGTRSDEALFNQHKSALFAFLLPSLTALRVLLGSDPPAASKGPMRSPAKSEIAIDSLHTLSAFAAVLDQSEGGLEGYHRVLYGMTDVLVSTGGSGAVRDLLLRTPAIDTCTPAEGSWWLSFGESVIRCVDQSSFEMVLKPLTERFITDDNHRPSFEAAHSLRLATIQAAANTLETKSTSRQQIQKDVISYADLLINQYTQGKLTNDQFRSVFPLLVESASKHSNHLVETCLSLLHLAKAPHTSSETLSQSRRVILISSAPHIASNRLRAYLDSLAQEIMSTPAGSSGRVELTGAAFRMVMRDLGDSGRLVGMGWWTEWRDRFDGAVGLREQARL